MQKKSLLIGSVLTVALVILVLWQWQVPTVARVKIRIFPNGNSVTSVSLTPFDQNGVLQPLKVEVISLTPNSPYDLWIGESANSYSSSYWIYTQLQSSVGELNGVFAIPYRSLLLQTSLCELTLGIQKASTGTYYLQVIEAKLN